MIIKDNRAKSEGRTIGAGQITFGTVFSGTIGNMTSIFFVFDGGIIDLQQWPYRHVVKYDGNGNYPTVTNYVPLSAYLTIEGEK